MQETQLNGESLDIVSENVSKLKELFPEILTEDKIDFDKLKEVLGKYTEDDSERYNFTWKGKSAALRLAQTPSTGTLRPCKEESKNWDTTENLYIEGDNLEVLKLLQKSYYGKIKMIYIDPPYNTGKDFIYPDNYRDNLYNYLEMTGQIDEDSKKISTSTDVSGRYHTKWLNMMYPRLRLARNLLTENGVILISIDDNEVDNLKKMCNDIFGEENFISQLVWRSKSGGANDSKLVAVDHEYILIFAKNVEITEMGTLPYTEELLKLYSSKDEFYEERGPYRPMLLMQKGLSFSKSLTYPIEAPDGTILRPDAGGAIWRWSSKVLEERMKKGFTEFKNTSDGWKIYTKQYLKIDYEGNPIERGKLLRSVITDYDGREGTRILQKLFENKIFTNPKSLKLLSLFCSLCSHDDDIILDFFSGSATTAHAVMNLNSEDNGHRKFVMVQLPEKTNEKEEAYKSGYKNICEIGKERIRRAGDKILSEMNQNGQISLDNKKNINLDIGFKVFKLNSSNLAKWDPEYDNLEQTLLDSVENLVTGRNQLDLIYEIMLKYGIDLTLPIEEYQIKDKTIYSIGFGALMVCLEDNIATELSTEIIKLKDDLSPEIMRVVFKDNGFASDSDKTNIKETLKTHGIEDFVTI
ncbi:MAG: site-specific DNA-methyltransferase [Methanobacteriaceae archaeon]|nr:site-specific DNA-methyltransferase [Methanobacteriaceae archaeon]MDO9626104.1 site-specific DNA-methyltransferase [Methanobacteriaceae archaeon]